ncbi:chorismate synthase [Helicobacter cholecystus]|uniref:Chorismate synthase n=1 Tax=Helicobacter cholecystus TaxID=45498 RepID=A0A3D8IXA1_9HELI|nr:chorismate synthase [Helicobacter cholecystus]RDU69909.1 chorismate synthase [Helicobacter cholecystus]VEJ25040.1 chorismate synthase [Helicobacter cholecystus]
MNTFGTALRLTTFGESHGECVGGVLDGLPANLSINLQSIHQAIKKRAGGRNAFVTPRSESDICEILSGVFEGKSTGAPLAFIVRNTHQKTQDYSNLKDVFRPSHADFTYFYKYGNSDYRGGGRASARETLVRVIASSIVEPLLQNISVQSGILGIGEIVGEQLDFSFASQSEIFALDQNKEFAQKQCITECRENGDSIGGVVLLRVRGDLLGLGEPIYYKLDAEIARAMMGINGVKAVEIGEGVHASKFKGSRYNDMLSKKGFLSNHSGGILGGIANGEEILVKIHFKPTPSIALPQTTLNKYGEEQMLQIKGRHDPCIAIRGSVVAQAMMKLVLADMILLRRRQ